MAADELSGTELAWLLTATAELYLAVRPGNQWHTGARAVRLRTCLESLFDLMGEASDAIEKLPPTRLSTARDVVRGPADLDVPSGVERLPAGGD